MKVENIKALLDSFYLAKRARDLLPALPKGVMPSFIQYLDTIGKLESKGLRVKVSDISDALDIPRPGVTRTVNDMVAKGYIRKSASEEDGRITYLSITKEGKKLSTIFDSEFFSHLKPQLDDISDEEALKTIETIEKFYKVMSERRF